RDHQERGNEADALWLSGEIAWRGDPPDLDAAEAGYRDALSIANALEMRPLVARCHLSLGLLRGEGSRGDAAREHLTTATAMLRAMGMAYWLKTAQAALELPGIRPRRARTSAVPGSGRSAMTATAVSLLGQQGSQARVPRG